MKVLWLTFTVFPEVQKLYTGFEDHKGSGGWLFGSAAALLDYSVDLELRVAIVSRFFKEYKELNGERIRYYAIPYGKGFDSIHNGYDCVWKSIKKEFNPDVVHVHGIETTLGLTYMRACGNENVVCSIQGLFDVIARYMFHGRTIGNMLKNTTIRDIAKWDTFLSVRRKASQRTYIQDTMLEGRYFIGRTSWDKAHLWAINPQAHYMFCNETLRSLFYQGRWDYNNCDRHSIFLSSIKGLHVFLRAFTLVKRDYPDAKVYVASSGNIMSSSIKGIIRRTGYEKELHSYIRQHNLQDHIVFLGPLSEDEMYKAYLSANVFVCPSSCENSSNSVGEAQLLGVPIVASYVGGMHDMIPNPNCGVLYRFEEYEMLAKDICDLFESSKKFDNTSMRKISHQRHDRHLNAERTLEIYQQISSRVSGIQPY